MVKEGKGTPKSRERLIRDIIEEYYEGPHPDDIEDVVDELILFINAQIQMENAKGKHEKYALVRTLEPIDVVNILNHKYKFRTVKRTKRASRDSSELMYYTENGWYENAEEFIEDVCLNIAPHLDEKKLKEVNRLFKAKTGKPIMECDNPNYVPLKDGIFDKEHYDQVGELIPYHSNMVITTPLETTFNPHATNPNITIEGEAFNVEDWMLEIAGGSEDIKELLWKVISASLHPYRPYNKAVLLYSPFGNNGKGTFIQLLENLIGESATLHMAIEEFSERFLPIEMLSSRLIVGDESNVDDFFSKAKNFKLAVTGDAINVEQKYKNKVAMNFHGLIVECVNSLPSTKDKTDSFYRRLLVVPMTARFEGKENKAIKSKYIYNQEVLEYILFKALMMDVKEGELVAPDEAVELLESYKEQNNTLIQWWNDEGSQVDYAWDSIPFGLLYGSYKWWCGNNTVRGDVNIGSKKFENEFIDHILPDLDGWELPKHKSNCFTVGRRFDNPEPLIGKYGVDELRNPNYTGRDWKKIGSNVGQYKKQYRGIVKK